MPIAGPGSFGTTRVSHLVPPVGNSVHTRCGKEARQNEILSAVFHGTREAPANFCVPRMGVQNVIDTGSTLLANLFGTHKSSDLAAPSAFPEPVAPPVFAARARP